MSLRTLIGQNNSTVAFLQQQDYANAVRSSTAAMAALQQLQRISPEIFSSTNGARILDTMDRCMLLSKVNNIEEHCEEDHTPFVYSHGIVVPCTGLPYELISPILIFNSALAHQLYARTVPDVTASQRLLLKSHRLYDLSLHAYNDADHNVLFQFAVMNNIAVIELETGNEVLARLYFERLMSTLMMLVDGEYTSRYKQLQGFLRNLPFQVKAAPAA